MTAGQQLSKLDNGTKTTIRKIQTALVSIKNNDKRPLTGSLNIITLQRKGLVKRNGTPYSSRHYYSKEAYCLTEKGENMLKITV